MTFSFTALGLIIAFVWVQIVACVVCAIGESVKVIHDTDDAKWWKPFFYFAEAAVLTFLLIVR